MRHLLWHGPGSTANPPRAARLGLSILLMTGLFLAAMVANPTPAQAHNDLVSSVPADGGTVATLPSTASLVFSEPLGTTGLQVAVTDESGAPVSGLAASGVAGATLTQPLPTSMAPGPYTLAYRVVSVDGHPVGGAIRFTIDAAAAPTTTVTSPSPAASSTGPSTPTAPTGGGTATGGTAAAPTVGSQATAGADSTSGLGWWWLVVVAAAVLGVGVVFGRRPWRARDRRRDDAS